MNNIYLIVAEVFSTSLHLTDKVRIVKRSKRKLGNFRQSGFIYFRPQNALVIQRRGKHIEGAVVFQKPRQRHRLTFGTALMKAADQL